MAQQTDISKIETTQTAVEWLLSELQIRLLKIKSEPDGVVRETMINSFLIDAEQAEAIEKEQRIKDYNVGYTDAQCNHINDAENYVNEQEYLNKQK